MCLSSDLGNAKSRIFTNSERRFVGVPPVVMLAVALAFAVGVAAAERRGDEVKVVEDEGSTEDPG